MSHLYVVLGFLCVTMGTIGIFLPILPTTPFLLLAAWLFLKANSRWRNWLLSHPRLGPFVSNYIKYKAIPLRSKVLTIVVLWCSIGFSVVLVHQLWLKLLLICIAIAVTIHLIMLNTLSK